MIASMFFGGVGVHVVQITNIQTTIHNTVQTTVQTAMQETNPALLDSLRLYIEEKEWILTNEQDTVFVRIKRATD